MKTSTIKPGLLVSLKTTIRGGVNYKRITIEADHATDEGSRRARWETQRDIPDPIEHEAATVARGKARSLVTAVCCMSSFGLLCPSERESDLDDAIKAARAIVDQHNEGAALTRVDVFVLAGRVAQDDAEAARAIGAEVRELLEAMRAGIAVADPVAIREAANKARAIGAMLSDDVSGKVGEAIAEARLAAREIVRRVEKAGQDSAGVVALCSVEKIEAARFAFLDLDQGEAQSETPAAAALDLEASEGETAQAVAMMAASFDLEG